VSARQRIGIAALAAPESGGVYQYAQAAIDALQARREFEFVVFTQPGSGVDARGLERHEISFARHAPATQAAMAAAVLLGRAPSSWIPAADRRALASVDAFFAPSVLPYPQLFFDKPYLVTLHDLQERHYPEFFSARERLQRWATHRAVSRRARRIVCESQFVKRDLMRFLAVDESRVEVVPAPPPAALHESRPGAEEIARVRHQRGLESDYIFYPAQLWPHKNHLALVRAFALLREKYPALRLVLTGGRQSAAAQVEAEIARLGLRERVSLPGFLPYGELRAIFEGARALVVPTLFESISIPVYEAFALGVPVCVSNVVGLPEQAGDAALLFDPRDPSAIAQAIDRVLGEPGLAARLVARGAARLAALEAVPYGERLAGAMLRAFDPRSMTLSSR